MIDFQVANDVIVVSATDLGGRLAQNTTVAAEQFIISEAAGDATERFVHNQSAGIPF